MPAVHAAPPQAVPAPRRAADATDLARPVAPPARGRRLRRVLVHRLPLVVAAAVAASGAAVVVPENADSRATLAARLDDRGRISAAAVALHVDGLLDREATAAKTSLSDPVVSPATFLAVTAGLGVDAAVLLDDQGRLLAAYPPRNVPIGTPVAAKYPHLMAALAGERSISDVVVAAGGTATLVGFAVPYDSQVGRRVLSGAYVMSRSPLQSYLIDVSPIARSAAYLVDDEQRVVASDGPAWHGARPLSEVDPRLSAALHAAPRGSYRAPGDDAVYTSQPVEGTPWRLVVSVPGRALYEPLESQSRTLWVIVGCLALVAAAAARLYARLTTTRNELARAALVDHLTGLGNRRQVTTQLEAALRTRSPQQEVAVLVVDVDHFKRINDTFGHDAGDHALRHVATMLAGVMRAGDAIGRWGGEEFLVVLPDTDLLTANDIGDRLREAVSSAAIRLGTGGDVVRLTVSIGCASTIDESSSVLIHKADRALYKAKRLGRDRTAVL